MIMKMDSKLFFILIVSLFFISCERQPLRFIKKESQRPISNILFIGDSLTYWNMGVYYHVRSLAESEIPSRRITVESVTRGSTPLGGLWEQAREKIEIGNYSIVVIQDDLGETSRDNFYVYVKKYSALIKEKGSNCILYMHYWYPFLRFTKEEVMSAFKKAALDNEIPISPVYFAFETLNKEKPDWILLEKDMMHPTWKGSYLIACVLYGTIFNRSPVGLSYNPEIAGLNANETKYLQEVAWKAVKTFRF